MTWRVIVTISAVWIVGRIVVTGELNDFNRFVWLPIVVAAWLFDGWEHWAEDRRKNETHHRSAR